MKNDHQYNYHTFLSNLGVASPWKTLIKKRRYPLAYHPGGIQTSDFRIPKQTWWPLDRAVSITRRPFKNFSQRGRQRGIRQIKTQRHHVYENERDWDAKISTGEIQTHYKCDHKCSLSSCIAWDLAGLELWSMETKTGHADRYTNASLEIKTLLLWPWLKGRWRIVLNGILFEMTKIKAWGTFFKLLWSNYMA